jgi:hypothetical protein
MLSKYPIHMGPLNSKYLARYYREHNSMYADAVKLIADIDRVKLSQPSLNPNDPFKPIGTGPQGST